MRASPRDRAFATASLAVVSGSMVAAQSRINGELATNLGSFPAAGVSFVTGLAALTSLTALPSFRRALRAVPMAIRGHTLRWWQVLGGMGGGLLVSTQTYAVPQVGVAAFLIAVVAGQGVSALVVDRHGWGPAAPIPFGVLRLIGAATAIGGVAVASSASSASAAGDSPVLPLILAFGVGLGGSVQYALNGRVTTVTRNALATAWINFTVGTATVMVAAGVAMALGRVRWPGSWDAPWWAWLGGVSGVVFIAGAAWAVQHTGVLVYGLVAVTSQVGVGLALDLANPAASARIGPQFLLGVTLTVLGATAAGVAARVSALRMPVSPPSAD